MLDLLAHATPITYRFPLPIWVYVLAAGLVVLLSAPAAVLGTHETEPRRSRNLYRVIRPLRLGAIGLALVSALFLLALVGGLGASTVESKEFFESPATVLIWVDFWVGLGVVSALVGNLWDFVSPLSAAARALDRALARRGVSQLAYPARLGQWPAVVLLVWWSWAELIWEQAKEPRTLAAIGLAYLVATLAGSAIFGAAAWLGNVEVFTVLARAFARFAPLELDPRSPDEWLATAPEERQVRLRPYGTGLRAEPPFPPGGGAFVLATLATVVFDGWSQTNRYASVESWILERSGWLARHEDVLGTLLMLAVVGAFVAAYLAVCALLEGGRIADAARRFAPTLVPIAAVYFVAHYFAYLLIAGQATLGVVVDPFGHGWNPDGLGEYELRKGIAPAGFVWWAQVVLIVAGHVIAILAAHRAAVAARRGARPWSVLARQAPLVLLMVAYTIAGLWVLAQQIRAGA